MKILFVASSKSHIVSFHLPYLAKFKELGFSVTVACSGADSGITNADKEFDIPFKKSMLSATNLKATVILRKLIKRERFDAIIVHTSLAAFFTRLAVFGLKRRPKVINMVHGYLFDVSSSLVKRIVYSFAEKLTAPVTDLLITMNRADHSYAVKNHLAKRITIVPGVGVDVSRFRRMDIDKDRARETLGIAKDAYVIVYAAEFSKRKSHSVLINALQYLDDRAVLLLPGRGDLLDECKSLAVSLGVEERVIFPGFAENMSLLYSISDCACTSSRSEGLPFNVMEAMLSGLPVVASRVKGHEDLIEDSVSGFLYTYGNSKECAEKIKQLMYTEHFAEQLSAVAQKRISEYTLDKILPVVMKEYLSVITSEDNS